MSPVETILARVGQLAPLPGTVLRLIQVVNDPRSTAEDVVEIIKYDQAVTAEILRMCNSAFYGLSRHIHSLEEAVRYVGALKVLQLLMAVHGRALLAKECQGYGLEPGILWKHSVAVALAAGLLAGNRPDLAPRAGVVFTAGLLHDIGKVILNQYVAEQFAEIVALVGGEEEGQGPRRSFSEAEKQVLGFSHQEIGARVAEAWQLPEPLIRCIRYHHEPGALDPPDPLVDTVYLADCLCLLLGIGLGADELHYRADAAVMARCGLRENDLEIAGATLLNELRRLDELFAGPEGANSRAATGDRQQPPDSARGQGGRRVAAAGSSGAAPGQPPDATA